MFGPVIIWKRQWELSSSVSFGMKVSVFEIFSTTGCLPLFIDIISLSVTWGLQYPLWYATCAKFDKTSRLAIASAVLRRRSTFLRISLLIVWNIVCSNLFLLSSALIILSSSSLSSGVI